MIAASWRIGGEGTRITRLLFHRPRTLLSHPLSLFLSPTTHHRRFFLKLIRNHGYVIAPSVGLERGRIAENDYYI
jgi:hypothetical protein